MASSGERARRVQREEVEQLAEKERWVCAGLRTGRLVVERMRGDGACLFRAVARQVYGHQDDHDRVRAECMDHIEADRAHFGVFVVGEPFDAYVARKRLKGTHGDHVEIQAMAEVYQRPMEVYDADTGTLVNLWHWETKEPPVRLVYSGGAHYDVMLDTEAPSFGVGTGMPGLEAGGGEATESRVVAKVMEDSELESAQLQMEQLVSAESRAEAEAAEAKAVADAQQLALRDAEEQERRQLEAALMASATESGHGGVGMDEGAEVEDAALQAAIAASYAQQ